MRTFICFLLIFAVITAAYPQNAVDFHQAIRSSASDRNYPAAIARLENLRDTQPDVFVLNNYDYLLARLSERIGDFPAAMKNYQRVAARDSVLKEYALFHQSRIARSSGNLLLERIYLRELALFFPKSLLNQAAANRLGRSWFDSGNYELAAKALATPAAGIQQSKKPQRPAAVHPVVRENRLLSAQANLRIGNAAAARESFENLIASLPNPAQPDDFALAAVAGLDVLDNGKVQPLPSEHLRRAAIYQFNREFDDARRHYAAIINNHPASGNVPDAIFQIGRGHASQGNFAEAVRSFERVREQFPDHPVSRDSLLQAASAYSRLAKFNESIARYKQYIAEYPNDERTDRAYLNIIDVLRDQGEEIAAQKWAANVQEDLKGKLPEALALFSEARIYIARNDWPNALRALERLRTLPYLGGVNVPGGTTMPEVKFLNGFVLEQMGRHAEAIDVYLSIPDGRNEYYGGRATERLKLLANDETAKPAVNEKLETLAAGLQSKDQNTQRMDIQAALRLTVFPEPRQKLLETLKQTYSKLPAYKTVPAFKFSDPGRQEPRRQKSMSANENVPKSVAGEMLFLGLYDEAAPEFEASLKGGPAASVTDAGFTLAVLYKRGDKAYRSVEFAEPLWQSVPADYQIDLILFDQLELLYPAPYADSLIEYSPPRNVDPRFLLSIMRQESRFRPDVKSSAAARGLMQFISSTAERIAGELGRENFEQEHLYDPSTAILFGSQYASNLFKLFPNQPHAVAASYNGGEDNMKRWMSRSKSNLPDRYVPEIAYSQSKDYVYKVMTSYRIYQILYDENLKRR